MTQSVIRVGKISSIDYDTGKARVVYEDRDNSVTVEMPIMVTEDTGLIREQDMVLVAHLSNGTAKGIIIGRFFGNMQPMDGKKDKYFKSLTHEENEAFIQYESKEMLIKAPKVYMETNAGKEDVIAKIKELERRVQELESKGD